MDFLVGFSFRMSEDVGKVVRGAPLFQVHGNTQ